jgi:hypothetical protein
VKVAGRWPEPAEPFLGGARLVRLNLWFENVDVPPLRHEVVQGGVDVPLAASENLVSPPQLRPLAVLALTEKQPAVEEPVHDLGRARFAYLDPLV